MNTKTIKLTPKMLRSLIVESFTSEQVGDGYDDLVQTLVDSVEDDWRRHMKTSPSEGQMEHELDNQVSRAADSLAVDIHAAIESNWKKLINGDFYR